MPTLNEIQQQIIDAKNSASELSALEVLTDSEKASISGLDSSSKVAIWRFFVWIVSYAMLTVYNLWDAFKAEITAKVEANRPHDIDWYKSRALDFQYGDTLITEGSNTGKYEIVDETKKIIKQVAVLSGDRKVIIKIATLSGDELVKIDDPDKVTAFTAYMDKQKDAGTELMIVNEDADKLKVEMDYYYDPLLVKSDGTLISDSSVNVVEVAINAYLKNIVFNGQFDINKMVDYIQQATGCKSLKLNFVGYKAGISTSYTQISRVYNTLSGYMKLEELSVNYYADI